MQAPFNLRQRVRRRRETLYEYDAMMKVPNVGLSRYPLTHLPMRIITPIVLLFGLMFQVILWQQGSTPYFDSWSIIYICRTTLTVSMLGLAACVVALFAEASARRYTWLPLSHFVMVITVLLATSVTVPGARE